MRTMGKVIILFAVIALALTMTVAAQESPAVTTYSSFGSFGSNTSSATAGLFKTDADNYMDYHRYSRVLGEEDKWFGFVTNKSGYLNLGYARNIGGIYLGAWYQGRLFSLSGGDKDTTLTPTYNDVSGILQQTVETTTYDADWLYTANQLEVLLGVAGHGIKVGIFESLYSNNHDGSTDNPVTVTNYMDGRVYHENETDEYTRNGGYIRPYVGWGSNFAVKEGMNLRPYVNFGLTIYSDELVDNSISYWTVNGSKQNVVNTINAGQNRGYLMPSINVGTKLDLSHENGRSSTITLDYGVDIYSYDNSYNASGVSGSVDGTVYWTGTGSITKVTAGAGTATITETPDLNITERSNLTHRITPSYQLTGQLESGVRLGFSASLPITYNSSTANNYTDSYTITKINYSSGSYGNTTTTEWNRTYGANTETTVFTTALNLGLGASYQLIPGRFTVNAGIRFTPFSYTNTVTTQVGRSVGSESTEKEVDQFGNVITNTKTVTGATGDIASDSVTSSGAWSLYNGGIAGGFVFYFTPSVALDLLVSASSTSSTVTSNSTAFGLDIANVNVLVTVKF